MGLLEKILEESLFADWLEGAGDAGSLDVPTRQIEEEVRKVIKLALVAKQAEKFELAEHYHKQAKEYKKLYKQQWEKCGNHVKEIQMLELKIKAKEREIENDINEAIRRYGNWTPNLGDSIEQGDFYIREFDLKKFLKEKRLQEKKAVEEKE